MYIIRDDQILGSNGWFPQDLPSAAEDPLQLEDS